MVFTMEKTGENTDDTVIPSAIQLSELRTRSMSIVEEKTKGSMTCRLSVTPVTDGVSDRRCQTRVLSDSDQDKVKSVQPDLGNSSSKVFPGYSHPSGARSQWPTRGLGATYSVPTRRTSYPCHPPYQPPVVHPANLQSRKLRTTSTMDYVPSPESFYAPEYVAKATFAASPNSLYMYDQERHDMQNTLNSASLGQTCSGPDMVTLMSAEPEFDLNPQYENSNSLEGFFGGALNGSSLMPSTSEGNLSSQIGAGAEKPISRGMLSLLGVGVQELKQEGPTLAELNMDPYLFEDIDSIIGKEEKPQLSSVTKQMISDPRKPATASKLTKLEPAQKLFASDTQFSSSQASGVRMSQPAQSVSQSTVQPLTNLFGSKTHNVAVVPPITVTASTIKTEPMDSSDSNKSCLHKMLSSPPLKPATQSPGFPVQSSPPGRQVMPVVGQSRAPPLGQQMKSESVEEKWKEIEKFIHDPEPSTSRKRKRHASGGSAIMSDEEDAKSSRMENFTDDEDSDSDADSDFSDTPFEESLTEMAKKSKQYFWQYNVQAKGPKGTRLKLNINDPDPHHPSHFEDPVFDVNSTSLVGIRHGGKARKGDGNEVSPNPRKLCQIGQQLFKLNRQINSCQVSNDLPASIRNKSRKEKNKLASRACRLKKKAQHEANKIKLTGLDGEQEMKIAGNTTDFVNEVIAKVEEGDPTGGLPIKPKVKK